LTVHHGCLYQPVGSIVCGGGTSCLGLHPYGRH